MDKAAYTIRIFVADGDPEGLRVIDRMNWTGSATIVPRDRWVTARTRKEFDRVGLYLLLGRDEQNEDLPRVYIGEGDGIGDRIDKHVNEKAFWDQAICFSSNSNGLNKSHVQWLESVLIRRARDIGQCILDNVSSPAKPTLSEHEEADISAFLEEMLRIIPLVGIRAFERPSIVEPASVRPPTVSQLPSVSSGACDTVVVPAQKDGFDRVFIGENAWHAVRLSRSMLDQIKYVAAYQTQPVSAITHLAPVRQIEPYGDNGKYRLVFSEPAKPIRAVPFGSATTGTMQGIRYTTRARLDTAKDVADLFD